MKTRAVRTGRIRHTPGIVLFIALVASAAHAQDFPYTYETRPLRGVSPFGDYALSPIDNIDAASGKLSLGIPLASLPTGYGGSGFQLGLAYDSNIFDVVPIVEPNNPPYELQVLWGLFGTGGWRYNVQNLGLELEERDPDFVDPGCNRAEDYRTYKLRIRLPDGSAHTLHLDGYGDELNDFYSGDGYYHVTPGGVPSMCAQSFPGPYPDLTGQALTYYTDDGTFLRLEMPAGPGPWSQKAWTLYHPDGRRVVGTGPNAVLLIDENGNETTIVRSCYDFPTCDQIYIWISDEYARRVILNFTVDEWAGGWRDQVLGPDPNGQPDPTEEPVVDWSIDWKYQTISGKTYYCDEAEISECTLTTAGPVVEYIQLPFADPSTPDAPPSELWNSYEFRYSDDDDNGFGELDYMRLPSGAVFEYAYELEGSGIYPTRQAANFNGVVDKQITHDQVTDFHWTYSFTNTSSTFTDQITGAVTTHSYADRQNDIWTGGLVYKIERPLGAVEQRT